MPQAIKSSTSPNVVWNSVFSVLLDHELSRFVVLGGGLGRFRLIRLYPIVEPYGHLLGYAGFLHRDAVEHVGNGHGPLRVGNDDEVRSIEKVTEDGSESADVRLIEGGVYLVQDAKGAWLAAKHRQQ